MKAKDDLRALLLKNQRHVVPRPLDAMSLPTHPSSGTRPTYWFVAVSSECKGPFTEGQLQAMITQGSVSRSSLVWCIGMSTWAPASSTALNVLFDLPPPLPVSESAIEPPIDTLDVSPVAAVPAEIAVKLSTRPDTAPPSVAISESEWSSTPRPWMRYFARSLDVGFGGVALGEAAGWIIPRELYGNVVLINIAAVILMAAAEPFFLSAWGWTPGKILFCVRVRNAGGGLMSFSDGYRRSWAVAVRGMGLGIPVISLFTLIGSYNRLTTLGITTWDEIGQFTVTHKDLGFMRSAIIVIAMIIVAALLINFIGQDS